MRKKITAILCILVVLCLSGCIGGNGGGEQQALDSDGDGYPDNIDDFPNDANLHYRETVLNQMGGYPEPYDEPWIIPPHEDKEITFYVTSDTKYVYIIGALSVWIDGEWVGGDVVEDSFIGVENPSGLNKYYGSPGRITINTENWGYWRVWVYNDADNKMEACLAISIWK